MAACYCSALTSVYNALVVAYATLYLCNSLLYDELPWTACGPAWGADAACYGLRDAQVGGPLGEKAGPAGVGEAAGSVPWRELKLEEGGRPRRYAADEGGGRTQPNERTAAADSPQLSRCTAAEAAAANSRGATRSSRFSKALRRTAK